MYTREKLVQLIKVLETGAIKLGKYVEYEIVKGGFKMEDWEQAIAVAEGVTQRGRQVSFTPSSE